MPRLSALALAAALSLAATLPAQEPKPEAVSALVETLNETTNREGMVRLAGDLLKRKDIDAALAALAREERKNPAAFNYSARITVGLAADARKNTEVAAQFLKRALETARALNSDEKLSLALRSMIDVYMDGQQYEDAVELCQEYLGKSGDEFNSFKVGVYETFVRAMALGGNADEALKEVRERGKKDTDGWLFLNLEGFVLREAGRYDEAAAAYREAARRVEASDGKEESKKILTERFRYTLSNVLGEKGDIDASVKILRDLLAARPESATYHNDLGYVLADHDRELPEAERLVRKALELDQKQRDEIARKNPGAVLPDNSAYVDSLGWVLFKQKKYKEAKVELARAVAMPDGATPETLDHLADCLMALGETDVAVEVWERAVDLPAAGKRDKARKASIEKKLEKAQKGK